MSDDGLLSREPSPAIKRAYDEISTCSQAVEAMEDLIAHLKASFGQLSEDISELQEQSQSITAKLQNRKNLEKYLGDVTREATLTPDFIEKVGSGEVGPAYVSLIEELDRKLKFAHRKDMDTTQATEESQVPLDNLRVKAADNIHKWFVTCVNDYAEGTRDRLSTQRAIIRCRSLLDFLRENAPDVSEASKTYYIEAISKLYHERYLSLTKQVTKNMAHISMSPETIVPAAQSRGNVKAKRVVGESTLFFSLGERAALLENMLAPQQQFGDDSYPVESLMRSLYQGLIDDFSSEYAFTSEVFGDDNVALSVFTPTLRLLEQFFEELLTKITDPICVILLLRFASAHKHEMTKRSVFKLDKHLNDVRAKLTKRFKAIVLMNQEAIETVDPKVFLENKATAHHANAMTRRFSEFATSLSLLMNEDVADMMTPELHMIGAAVIDLLERTSREFGSDELSDVFLINNYFLVISSLRTIQGCVLLDLLERKLRESTASFVELELLKNFKPLVEVVKAAFPKIDAADPPRHINIQENALKDIVTGFRKTYIAKMKRISESLILMFGDFMNGRDILQRIAARLVLYWTKFLELAKVAAPEAPWLSKVGSPEQLAQSLRPITESL